MRRSASTSRPRPTCPPRWRGPSSTPRSTSSGRCGCSPPPATRPSSSARPAERSTASAERPAREDDPLLPLSPYGIAKLAGEEYLAGWNRMHGTRHTALRFANVYGPRQEAGLEGGVVAIFLNAMAAGEETPIYGDGQQTRDFVHVDDVVRALLAAVGRGGAFNVGSGVETPILELHEQCSAVTGDAARAAASARRARATSCAASSTCRSSSASSAGGSRSRSTTGCAGPGTGCSSEEGGRAGGTK